MGIEIYNDVDDRNMIAPKLFVKLLGKQLFEFCFKFIDIAGGAEK